MTATMTPPPTAIAAPSTVPLLLLIATTTLPAPVLANDNGLALTPPMGWRSWNQYGPNVTQTLLTRIMDGMVNRSRLDPHTGTPTSLCDLGYCDVGLDDNWQDCGSPNAAEGMHYHDIHGNPIVNTQRFPDLKKMTDHAHSLGLTAGFYGNNCICKDHCRNDTECDAQIRGDVNAFVDFNFDSWKLDGCGNENDLHKFDQYLRERLGPNRPIMVESCHWGVKKYDPDRTKPPRVGCPMNFYRSSGDIGLSYGSVMANLGSVERYRAGNLSYPGCWAYPDMLEVGMRRRDNDENSNGKKGDIGLTPAETRSHFGAWCIVSSPLILGHDVHDDEVTDAIWDVIANTEAIAVNQAYAGDSGGVYEKSDDVVELPIATDTVGDGYDDIDGDDDAAVTIGPLRQQQRLAKSNGVPPTPFASPSAKVEVPSYQYLSKPLGGGKVAVLLMNSGSEPTTLTAKFEDVPGLEGGCCRHGTVENCGNEENDANKSNKNDNNNSNDKCPCRCRYRVRDVWAHEDLGSFHGSWSGVVKSHDAAFLIVQQEHSTKTRMDG